VSWLPPDFRAPARLDLPTGHHLRQIRGDDLDLDHPAVMGSQERLWALFGPVWDWPPADMTREEDHEDLVRHADEMTRNESFNYAVFDADETALLGCVYVDPPEAEGYDAEVVWWVVDDEVGSDLERTLTEAVPTWLAARWPLRSPRIVGRDLTWDAWHAEQREERPGPKALVAAAAARDAGTSAAGGAAGRHARGGESTMDVLDRLQDRVAVISDRVVGAPIERDGATVVPVVAVRGGGGGGVGSDPASGGEGSGGGWGAVARPVGAYVLEGGHVRYQPAVDVTRIVIGGQLVAVVALLVVRRALRRRR
jgi:uncharacterized spore protein YtfJ